MSKKAIKGFPRLKKGKCKIPTKIFEVLTPMLNVNKDVLIYLPDALDGPNEEELKYIR